MGKQLKYSFKQLERAFRTKEFLSMFFKRMDKDLVKYYGKNEAIKILKLLGRKEIEVINPEIFFTAQNNINDPAIEMFARIKNMPDFFRAYSVECKKLIALKCSKINLPLFFFAIGQIDAAGQLNIYDRVIKDFIMSVSTADPTEQSLVFQVLDFPIFKMTKENLVPKLSGFQYYAAIHRFAAAYANILDNPNYEGLALPKIEVIRPIYRDDKDQALHYLRDTFGMSRNKLDKIAGDVQTFTKDNSELRALVSILSSHRPNISYDEDTIIKRAIEISNERPFKIYTKDQLTEGISNPYISRRRYYEISEHTFIGLDTCKFFSENIQSEIEINCESYKCFKNMRDFKNIRALIVAAAKVALLKSRNIQHKVAKILISLTNISFYSEAFLNAVRKLEQALSSQYNKEFFITVKYIKGFEASTIDSLKTEYIRVISDIHIDINSKEGYSFDFGNDYIINCGDTASTYTEAISWMLTNMKQGFTVIGNHLGYNYPFPEKGILSVPNTRTEQGKALNRLLKDNINLSILGKRHPIKWNGITFVGGTLYSDLMLYGEENFAFCKEAATRSINDFKRCYKRECRGTVKPWTIEDHLAAFEEGRRRLVTNIKKTTVGPIIVATHFAPLPYSVAPEYENDPLTAYFCSDLRDIFKKYHRIRVWCHGHTHNKFDYIYRRKCEDGKWHETRVICNPFGYYNENHAELPYNYGTRIKVADIKSRIPWTKILAEEIKSGKIKVIEERS